MTEIKGYRVLSTEEIAAINDVKFVADGVGDLVGHLKLDETIDQRWVSIANTHLQEGFMALVRAIAKPTGF